MYLERERERERDKRNLGKNVKIYLRKRERVFVRQRMGK